MTTKQHENVKRLTSIIDENDRFFDEEIRELNVLLASLKSSDIPQQYRKQTIEMIGVMGATGNIYAECQQAVTHMYDELNAMT